jgi:hypothetical protein
MGIATSHVRPGPERISLTPKMRREIEAFAKATEPIDESVPTKFGNEGEARVSHWLKSHGYEVKKLRTRLGADLIANGKRVEVKCARPDKDGEWTFNLHHHGVLDEGRVDLYVFRVEGLPATKKPLHLIIPAPLKRLTLAMTVRSLILTWGRYANRFDLLGEVAAERQLGGEAI